MEGQKDLYDISWQVEESTYRADPALSYSTLAKYEREGFEKLDKLFDKVSSPSLTFGSAVDSIITGGEKEFNDRFTVMDINLTDSGIEIAKALAANYEFTQYEHFEDIPESYVSTVAKETGFWKADKWDAKRYSEVLKTGNISDYYKTLIDTDKTVISTQTYKDVLACVEALKTSPSTMQYFAVDDPFSGIKRYYQLKFKAKFGGVTYRIMADLICVDYENKVVYPIDLKTSGHSEYSFEDSFLTWSYMIQARLYWRVIKANLMADDYFKDFKLTDYKFIVINKSTLTPLVWEFPLTTSRGTLIDDKGNEYRDPFEIGKELRGYLDNKPRVPNGISLDKPNIINCLKIKE